MSSFKVVARNSGIFAAVSVLQKSGMLLLLPVYTAYLERSQYGIFGVVNSLVDFFCILFLLAMNGAANRLYHEYKEDPEKVRRLWGTILLFVAANSLVMAGVLLLLQDRLFSLIADGIPFYPYLTVAIGTMLLTPLYRIYLVTLQTRQQGARYGLATFGFFVLSTVMGLVFVVAADMRAMGLLLANLLASAGMVVYCLWVFLPQVSLRIDRDLLKQALRYALPLVPHTLSGWTVTTLDRIFINKIRSADAVGLYHVGFQFGNIINLITMAVNQAYVPWMFENLKAGEDGRRRVVVFAEVATLCFALAATGLSLLSPEILRILVAESYHSAWVVIPLISFAFVYMGLYTFFVGPLFYNIAGSKYVSMASLSSALLNAVLNALFIPRWGIVGAAATSLVSMVFLSVVVMILSRRIEPVPFAFRRMYATATVLALVSGATYLEGQVPGWVSLVVRLSLLLVAGAVVLWWRGRQLIQVLRAFLRQRSRGIREDGGSE